MYTAMVVIHLTVCLFLIFIILIQSSKGAEMGAAFGGSSQTLFGSRGAATFLSKLTTGMAIAFMVTSLLLAITSIKRGSVVSSFPVQETAEKPFANTTSGPIQDEQPVAPGQGETKETPAAPAEDSKQ
jgi:preprotein translocase subunit SecG